MHSGANGSHPDLQARRTMLLELLKRHEGQGGARTCQESGSFPLGTDGRASEGAAGRPLHYQAEERC